MEGALEKTLIRERTNPRAEKAGLFSRQEMESLVRSLAGPSWDEWLENSFGPPLGTDPQLSALSDEQLEKVLTQMLEQMVEEGWKRG